MHSPSGLIRSLRFLALLLQLLLSTAGGLADVRLELEAMEAQLHMESPDHECNERNHPEECALCQVLRAPRLLPASTSPKLVVAEVAPVPVTVAGPTRRDARSPSLPRGPPQLS